MRPEVLDQIIRYVENAVDETPIKRVVFAFHGGEPTLAKASKARRFCEDARRRLEPKTEIAFAVQTNGVHVSDDWIRLIVEERMGVGISIDGERNVHDRFRVDYHGRGTYDRVCDTLGKLLPLDAEGIIRLTALTVMGSEFNGLTFYRHLVEDLGLRHLKLIFPDRTGDMRPNENEQRELTRMLCEMFDYWLLNHYESVDVTLFDAVVHGLLASQYNKRGARDRITMGIAVLSDGRVRISDDFMIASDWFWKQRELKIFDSKFTDYLNQPHLKALVNGSIYAPTECLTCPYADSCAGGEVAHRFIRDAGFDNRSMYCQTLKGFYGHVDRYLQIGSARIHREAAGPMLS